VLAQSFAQLATVILTILRRKMAEGENHQVPTGKLKVVFMSENYIYTTKLMKTF
jgi:hypothetical protein